MPNLFVFITLLLLRFHVSFGWGKFPTPKQLGLTELVSKLSEVTTTNTTSLTLVQQINALIDSTAAQVAKSSSLVSAQVNELTVAGGIVNRTVDQVKLNEQGRIAIIKEYNQDVLQANQLLVDMTTGSQQINDVIAVANRIKGVLSTDIEKINEAISVTNDWMVKMDAWVAFVLDETNQIDQAQANLLSWGDDTKTNVNTHEVAITKLAREVYDLETQIMDMGNLLLSSGKLLGYTPTILSVPAAAGGLGWQYTLWG